MFKRIKGRKYNNVIVTIDGIKFDSKRESERYLILKDAQSKRIISELQVHVKYILIPQITEKYIVHLKTKDKEKVRTVQQPITYTCDFQYMKDGLLVVEDIKISAKLIPKEYVLKEKMMLYTHNIKIKRVYQSAEPV